MSNSWVAEIINEKKLCSVRIKVEYGKPQMPDDDEYFKRENWEKLSEINTQRFHTSAKFEMRSKTTKNGHANQCIYDCMGLICSNLLYNDASPGSADFSSLELSSVNHLKNDLTPFVWAALLDGNTISHVDGKVDRVGVNIRKYYKVRPILIQGMMYVFD